MDASLKLSDGNIRPALRSYLMAMHGSEPGTVIIDELGLCRGQVRVDLAVVNGLFYGYEIKSDRDSLRRLSDQVSLYGLVVDRATVVVGSRHLQEATKIIPAWWEILRFELKSGSPCFEAERPGRENPGRDARALVELLWLDDAIALLEQRGAARGVKGKPRRVLWDRICERFDVEEIAAAVRAQIKARASHKALPRPL